MKKRFALLLCISIVSQVAVAQWTFTSSISKSGNCNSIDALGANIWGAIGNSVAKQASFPTREQCEAVRAGYTGSYSDGGCTTRVITTPCKGPAGTSSGVDILSSGQGHSFYSVHGANEIHDWSSEYMERMLTFNRDGIGNIPTFLHTHDGEYDRVRGFERSNFGTPSYSGNNYTGNRYNINRFETPTVMSWEDFAERYKIHETMDFVRTTIYQELPPMPTEEFFEYCNSLTQDAEHIRELAPEVNYKIYCSSTNEGGETIQNVFIKYITPQNTQLNILEDPFSSTANQLQDVIPLSTDNPLVANTPVETTSDIDEEIRRLNEEIEELQRKKKQEEYQAMFAERMINSLELNQLEESYYINRNLIDLGIGQIPFDAAGPAGDLVGKTFSNAIEHQLEQEREEAGMPQEPENIVADIISDFRDIPGIGELAKHYLGGFAAWVVVNSPEIGRAIGHTAAKVNIFFQQREWERKAELAKGNMQETDRQIEIKERERDILYKNKTENDSL